MGTPAGLANMEATINFQASFLAYIFDFQFLAIVLFGCLPLIFFMSNTDTRNTVG